MPRHTVRERAKGRSHGPGKPKGVKSRGAKVPKFKAAAKKRRK